MLVIDQDIINSSNQESVSFTFAGAEVGLVITILLGVPMGCPVLVAWEQFIHQISKFQEFI